MSLSDTGRNQLLTWNNSPGQNTDKDRPDFQGWN